MREEPAITDWRLPLYCAAIGASFDTGEPPNFPIVCIGASARRWALVQGFRRVLSGVHVSDAPVSEPNEVFPRPLPRHNNHVRFCVREGRHGKNPRDTAIREFAEDIEFTLPKHGRVAFAERLAARGFQGNPRKTPMPEI